jgi:hypothetical protein
MLPKYIIQVIYAFFILRRFVGVVLLGGILLAGQALSAQELRLDDYPRLYFHHDSISIGSVLRVSLSYCHEADKAVLFPDSSYNFSPFTWVSRQYFVTQTQGQISRDSVVYQLTTYELDASQALALPVFMVNTIDCTQVYSNTVEVKLKPLVYGHLDSLQYKAYTDIQTLEEQFNYPYLIAATLGVVLLLWGGWRIFGQGILKRYRLYQFRTQHSKFVKDFSRISTRIRIKQSPEDLEKALVLWKKHLEHLESEPFSTYTSKEIREKVPNETLAASLKRIDRAIYGQEFTEELADALEVLRNFSVERFSHQQTRLQHA